MLVVVSLVGVSLVALAFCFFRASPRPFPFEPRHTLICAAHQDDCVIAGAEYALFALEAGKTVRIAYLTCGGPDRLSSIAATRRHEALAAWSLVGVPAECLRFIDLPESQPEGPVQQSASQLVEARQALLDGICDELPSRGAIIVPARGEMHIDHRTLRKLATEAVEHSRRDDLLILESPEYNGFVSFLHGPQRALNIVLRFLPLGSRLLKPYFGHTNFVDGGRAYWFGNTPERLETKKNMLRRFPSQDVNTLLAWFGHRTLYRETKLDLMRETDLPRGFILPRVPAVAGMSVVLAFVLLLATGFALLFEIAHLFPFTLEGSGRLALFAAATGIGIAYVLRLLRKQVSFVTACFVWFPTLGLLAGALL
jgi:LmbE family N-acetylglucosaminyl deacetylase